MNKKTEAEMQKWASIMLVGGALFAVCALYFTSKGDFDYLLSKGTIGDTIGGITAPFINFMGALLVYYALRAQINANKLIFDQFEYQKISAYILGQISLIREDIKDFSFTNSAITADKAQFGAEGISRLLEALRHPDHGEQISIYQSREINQVAMLLERIYTILKKIDSYGLDENDKKEFYETIVYTYQTQLKPGLDSNEKFRFNKLESESNAQKKIGITEGIYSKYDDIELIVNRLNIAS